MGRKETFQEGSLAGKGGDKIVYSSFIPSKTSQQFVVVHGFSEHMRCYYEVAEELSETGVAVHLMDLPGHGLSDGVRGHIGRFQQFRDTVDLLMKSNPQYLKTKPTFLFGHSLGGLIAASYYIQNRPPIKGLILSSPLMGFPFIRSLPVWLLTRYLRVRQPAYQLPNLRNVAALSRNPLKWGEYVSDPYRLYTITPSLFQSMVAETKLLQKRVNQIKIPLLVFYSAKDPVIDTCAVERFHAAVGSEDKTLSALTEARHELLQEEEKPLILEKMLSWMKERT